MSPPLWRASSAQDADRPTTTLPFRSPAMSFTVYPAIDVRDGRVVRLLQGDYDRQTVYPVDPFEQAVRYFEDGAQWLHLVDLDAARAGGWTLAGLVKRLKASTGLRIQTGGGVRSEADLEAVFAAGADRVVVGTLAVREPDLVCEWIKTHGANRITVALDCRLDQGGEWRLPVHGWTESSGWSLEDTLAAYANAGLRHVLSTDIDRDGMLSGPNLGLYRELRRLAPWLEVQASGGVRGVEDVAAAREVGAAGIILGKALLEGRLGLQEALAC
jgi:phosphoribosylformimino-5-aminoimidazole carboxamide ribotide isomerase